MRKKNVPHFVYILKQDDQIVYVGCTKNLHQRMRCHKNKIHNNVEVVKYKTKYIAMYYERQLIVKHFPKYNYIPKHMIEYKASKYYKEIHAQA
jgi:predicted GIY-YIG superfamily endonuclease